MSPPRVFTNIGFIGWIIIFFAIVIGSTTGRYSYRVSRLELPVAGLHDDLDGLRIVQISDLHLAGFHKQPQKLSLAIRAVMNEKPDILVNSGDFVTIGQGEFGRFDTILSRAKGTIASVAVLGNHDIGTYHPSFNIAFRDSNIARMEEHIARSGYLLLNDSSYTVKKGAARLALAGVVTMGRHPGMIHGDVSRALNGTDSADFTILVSHDPNHWKEKIAGKTDVGLTLSGHTHAMQMGIKTKRFRWSPSKHFYPNWGGLYTEGRQYLYVNTGLGVLGIPFRLGIRPEITVIELKKAI
jgi:predicted MPP superfamily phosphohydrolase